MNQHAYQEIPGYPNAFTKNPKQYIALISETVDWLHREKKAPNHITEPIADFIIYISFLITDPLTWRNFFYSARSKALRSYTTPNAFWITVQRHLTTSDVAKLCMILLPRINKEKYFPTPDPTPPQETITPRTFTKDTRDKLYHTSTPQRIDSGAIQQLITQIPRRSPEQLRIAARATPTPKRKQTKTLTGSVVPYITDHAPSTNYLKVYFFIKGCTKNRFSSRGRYVYPYGQKYVAKKLNISLHSVARAFSWLKRKHIIFKRRPENPKRRRTATWFICVTWEQSRYWLDPLHRRRKN